MARRNVGIALAAVLTATGAWAQQFTQFGSGWAVAEELFGGKPVRLEHGDVEYDETTNELKIWTFQPASLMMLDAGTVVAGTEFALTYRLVNATFAEQVSVADLVWGTWGPDANGADDDLSTEDDNRVLLSFARTVPSPVTVRREGGGKDTDTVTFRIAVDADQESVAFALDAQGRYTGGLKAVYFFLPDIIASDLRAPVPDDPALVDGRSVRVLAAVSQRKSGGTAIDASVKAAGSCTQATGCEAIRPVRVIADIANTAGGGLISLAPADERSVLVDDQGEALEPQRAPLATVEVVVAENRLLVHDRAGDIVEGFDGDLAGSLAVKVSSDGFAEGDAVYVDANGNGRMDGREAFDIDGGVAANAVPLREGPMTVYYVPTGASPLSHGTAFTTTATTEFARADNLVRSAAPATAKLKLQGIRDRAAKAYAIAPLSSTDRANVRVTCETLAEAGCNVFLDCKDAAGTVTFGDAGALLGPGTTARWSQADIAGALRLDEGWQGRLACEVLSTAPITVQVLTRSAGVLVNNTYVSTGGT